jgi:hypothetical protein
MKKEKRYTYKVWVEIERIEINEYGEEIGNHEEGELFGADPEKVGNTESLCNALSIQQTLIRKGESII